jgi:alkylation response protein AidB-like acyl-CoA dehydrogenase
MLKLFGSEPALRIADLSSALLGPYATVEAPTEAIPDAARWHHHVLGARRYTIAGGTSEIQRHHRRAGTRLAEGLGPSSECESGAAV